MNLRLLGPTALAVLSIAAPALGQAPGPATAEAKRRLRADDLYAFKVVGDPRLSPDGQWVAYTVESLDAKDDLVETVIENQPAGSATGSPALTLGARRGNRS